MYLYSNNNYRRGVAFKRSGGHELGGKEVTQWCKYSTY